MPESIAWSLSAGGSSGSGISAAGTLLVDASMSVSRSFDAAGAETDVELMIDKVDNVSFLAISSDLNDGKVTVQGTGDKRALTGPIVLFGEAVKLFATDLSVVKVQNTSPDKAAHLTILVGLNIVSTP
ncbi:hypothetical protein [Primorskyibacter sp. 2E233]|uniref:hypothetical protein n=1 Tax=Primorskyibacter sp. 2E233 TaxID=3413431 RepID=UPI003BF4099E